MKVIRMESCPRCGSEKTGEIVPSFGTTDADRRYTERMSKKGLAIKIVTPEEFRGYYNSFCLNAYCFTCKHAFIGDKEKIELEEEKENEFRAKHGLNDTSEKISLIERIMIRFKRTLF